MEALLDLKNSHLMLRTYELLDFIKKFLKKIENAINQLGFEFITE